jgi:hypothetical protein
LQVDLLLSAHCFTHGGMQVEIFGVFSKVVKQGFPFDLMGYWGGAFALEPAKTPHITVVVTAR